MRNWIQCYEPEPEDHAAQAALLDDEYCRKMTAYAAENTECVQSLWEQEYL